MDHTEVLAQELLASVRLLGATESGSSRTNDWLNMTAHAIHLSRAGDHVGVESVLTLLNIDLAEKEVDNRRRCC